eukprot:GAHX01002378.1.p1 GENE.GAHX01002378.1~~GAHX01002378.1.p1  ORF type:complete len:367 (-),score=43.09 GAHX01002378.1:38-1138(-)
MKSIKFRTNLKLQYSPIYRIKINNFDAFKNKTTSECLNFLPSQMFNHSIKSFLNKHNTPAFVNRLELDEILILTQSQDTIQEFLDFLCSSLPLCNTCLSTLEITPHKVTIDHQPLQLQTKTFNIFSINNTPLSLSITKLNLDSEDHKALQDRILKQHILNNLTHEFNNMSWSRNQDLIQTPSLIQVKGLKRDQVIEMDKWKIMLTINNHTLKVYVQPLKIFLKYYTETDALCNYKCLTWPNFTKAVVPESENNYALNKAKFGCLEYYWNNKYNYSLENNVEYFDVCFNVFKKEGARIYFELSDSLTYPADCVFKEIMKEEIVELSNEEWNRFVYCLERTKVGEDVMMIREEEMTKVQRSEGSVVDK